MFALIYSTFWKKLITIFFNYFIFHFLDKVCLFRVFWYFVRNKRQLGYNKTDLEIRWQIAEIDFLHKLSKRWGVVDNKRHEEGNEASVLEVSSQRVVWTFRRQCEAHIRYSEASITFQESDCRILLIFNIF